MQNKLIIAALALMLPLTAAAQAPLPSVTVIEAQPQDFTLTTRLPGRIKASTVAEVRPQVSGIIRERLFTEGVPVEEGQPLYKIEDESYAAAVAAAKAAVAQAQANADLAERDAARVERLFRNNTVSEQNRDSARATREAADAALQLAQAQLMSAEIDLERTTIRAPIAGVIGLSQTTTGALVGAQQATALATIRALDPIYVDVTQSANDLLRWQEDGRSGKLPENEATLILPTGSTFPERGRLEAAEPQVEPTTGMVTLRITFPNPDSILLPGLYVEVEMPQSTAEGAVLVPQNAVMRDQTGAAHAWIVEGGKVVVRDLTVETTSGNTWVVTGGLQPGDKIITSGFQKIAPGADVQIVDDAAPAGEAGTEAAATEPGENAADAPAQDAPATQEGQ
ncbi:MAG: efflux RND transporter periplasmic adaptor subunit [Paracoccus sp. (in: a-proteobacteria)]|uniref:efflux RND transporter periplasmic adaptor subunit n=1 Tax=Paracoccus sp. TaxID=267 RepID=UPI0026E0856A|nr:efflux RND transporter periplasmic adaptor subunit [Paracoccus sp. (in: a-proteobacteria)]MDO5620902.1 efflux RND transporter periplasmic adaptor subunit [Paracoccus sp. (in: a-proteobacteria)]